MRGRFRNESGSVVEVRLRRINELGWWVESEWWVSSRKLALMRKAQLTPFPRGVKA